MSTATPSPTERVATPHARNAPVSAAAIVVPSPDDAPRYCHSSGRSHRRASLGHIASKYALFGPRRAPGALDRLHNLRYPPK